MSQINCDACSDLKTYAPNFAENGVTDTECTSLAADTGLNPSLTLKHKDADDLHDVNDCLVGRQVQDLEKYDVCDWQDFMRGFIPNVYETIKGIICALGGAWTYIHNLLSRVSSLETRVTNLETTVAGHTTQISNLNTKYNSLKNIVDQILEAISGSDNTVTVVRKYSYTVPVTKFIETWKANCTTMEGTSSQVTAWFSGGPGECFISIPVEEMENVVGVWAQPYVVPNRNPFDGVGKMFMETAAIQTWERSGDNIIVNFDTYELAPQRIESGGTVTQNGGPYPLTIDFLVVGTKTITTAG